MSPDVSPVGYVVSLNIPGRQDANLCYPKIGLNVLVMEGRIECFTWPAIYQLDFRSMRYMHIYTAGYIDGVDAFVNTPAITVGKCSKIE